MSASLTKARFFVAAAACDAFALDDFEAVAGWIEAGDFAFIEGLGDEADIYEIELDQEERPIKRKLRSHDDTVAIGFVRSATDNGQVALLFARDELKARPFKITTEIGTPIYFAGLTKAHRLTFNADDGVIMREFEIARTSPIVEA